MVAVTVTVPAPVAESVFPLIVAPVAPASLTLQLIVLFVAFAGATVPESVRPVPAVDVVGTPVISVTDTNGRLTVMVKSWV